MILTALLITLTSFISEPPKEINLNEYYCSKTKKTCESDDFIRITDPQSDPDCVGYILKTCTTECYTNGIWFVTGGS